VKEGISYVIIPALGRIKQERLYPVLYVSHSNSLQVKIKLKGAAFRYQPVQT